MKTKLAKLQDTRPTKHLTLKTAPVVLQLSYLHNKIRHQLQECGTETRSISTLHTFT